MRSSKQVKEEIKLVLADVKQIHTKAPVDPNQVLEDIVEIMMADKLRGMGKDDLLEIWQMEKPYYMQYGVGSYDLLMIKNLDKRVMGLIQSTYNLLHKGGSFDNVKPFNARLLSHAFKNITSYKIIENYIAKDEVTEEIFDIKICITSNRRMVRFCIIADQWRFAF